MVLIISLLREFLIILNVFFIVLDRGFGGGCDFFFFSFGGGFVKYY